MANRREEERERLREAREAQEKTSKGSEKRRLMLAYVAAGVIGLIVIVGIVVVITSSGGGTSGEAHIDTRSGSTNGIETDDRTGTPPPPAKTTNLKVAAKKAGCVLKLHLKDEGHQHIAPGTEAPDYKTNPPTSGNHVEPPYQQADGAYTEQPEPIDMVHSMEHGRMEIQYAPDLPETAQLELKGLYDTMYAATLLFPNEEMPYEVAATTWTNLLGCKEYKGAATLDAIRAFGKQTWGKYGGEPAEGFPFTGPTPAEPSEPKS